MTAEARARRSDAAVRYAREIDEALDDIRTRATEIGKAIGEVGPATAAATLGDYARERLARAVLLLRYHR